MRVSQLLDIPGLRIRSECTRHYGSKPLQCRIHHHHVLLRRSLTASSKHHNTKSPTGFSPTSRHRTSQKPCIPAVHRSVRQSQRRTHPRTAPHCARLHHSCQKAAQRIRTLTASVEQATLADTAAVTGHGYHRRAREGKKRNRQPQAMQGAAVNNPTVVSFLPPVS